MKAVGICMLGNVVGTLSEVSFAPGTTWYCTMLATVAAGNALIAAKGIPERKKAASSGAKTVNTEFRSDTALSKPAFVTAAFKIEKFALLLSTSPIVLPEGAGFGNGSGSGTFSFLVQELITRINNTGKKNLEKSVCCFIISFL